MTPISPPCARLRGRDRLAITWIVRVLRNLIVGLVWRPLLAAIGPVGSDGLEHVPTGGAVVATNHTSHADSVILQVALHRGGHRKVVAAAAADYWFTGWGRTITGSVLGGAVPMPRIGEAGLATISALVEDGWTVIVFPEGTRRVGSARWRRGIGQLALDGVPVVAGRIDGAGSMLPKGGRVPCPTPVSVTFSLVSQALGPERPPTVKPNAEDVAGALQRQSERLPTTDRAASWPQRTSSRLTTNATTIGPLILAAWAAAEALMWPLVPDLALAGMAFAAPWMLRRLWTSTVLASAATGALAVMAAGIGLSWPLPLITPQMSAHAVSMVADSGASAVLAQPISGVPYKAFVVAAGDMGVNPLQWAGWTVIARGARMGAVATIAASAGHAGRRLLGPRGWWEHAHVAVVLAGLAAFVIGWSWVIASWR